MRDGGALKEEGQLEGHMTICVYSRSSIAKRRQRPGVRSCWLGRPLGLVRCVGRGSCSGELAKPWA